MERRWRCTAAAAAVMDIVLVGGGLLQRGIRRLAVVAVAVVRVCQRGPPTKISSNVRVQCVFVQTCALSSIQ